VNSLIQRGLTTFDLRAILQKRYNLRACVFHSIVDFTYLLGSRENVFSRTCVLPKIECIFGAKSCSLGILPLPTNFQKLSTVWRNGQLVWQGGHFEKVAVSG